MSVVLGLGVVADLAVGRETFSSEGVDRHIPALPVTSV